SPALASASPARRASLGDDGLLARRRLGGCRTCPALRVQHGNGRLHIQHESGRWILAFLAEGLAFVADDWDYHHARRWLVCHVSIRDGVLEARDEFSGSRGTVARRFAG